MNLFNVSQKSLLIHESKETLLEGLKLVVLRLQRGTQWKTLRKDSDDEQMHFEFCLDPLEDHSDD